MTATAKGSARPRPQRPAPAPAANGFPVLRLKTPANGRKAAKRVPLFYIDDTEYTMLAEPTAALALQYLDTIQRKGPDAGFSFAMDQMIGADAYQDLIGYSALTKDEFAQVAKVVTDHLLGALEDGQEDPKSYLTARARQVLWVTRYLPDLASDFSVLHRVGDIGAMPAVAFFSLASRLAAYQGVMRARVAAEAEAEAGGPQMPPQVAAGPPPQMVGASRAELQSEPSFAGIFSFNQPSGASKPA